MAPITGAQTVLIAKKTTTFGTEVAASTGDKLGVTGFTPADDSDLIPANSLGTGLVMEVNTERGNVRATAALSMITGYENGFDLFLAQMLGSPAAPTEQTVGQGDYQHVISMSTANANNGWLTLARLLKSDTVESFPSCAVTSMKFSVKSPTAPLTVDIDLVADQRIRTSAINTPSVLNASTMKDQTSIIVKNESEFLIDLASTGALTSADRVAITDWNLTLNRPLRITPEIKGVAGNGEFDSDGFVTGELQITMSKMNAVTFWDAVDSGAFFKSSFIVNGAAIGTGVNRMFKMNLPRLKILKLPDYNLSEAGNNPVSVTFTIYAADAAPTGFTSVYPQATLINTRTASY